MKYFVKAAMEMTVEVNTGSAATYVISGSMESVLRLPLQWLRA